MRDMTRRATSLLLLLCLSQSLFAFEEELQFVNGLTQAGFPKLAEKVLSRTLEKHPGAKDAAPELRVRILIADKQFEQAAQQIKALQSPPRSASTPPQEKNKKKYLRERTGRSDATTGKGLWLFLAKTATAARQLPAAEVAYKNYFKDISKADDTTGQAAFNYGELLEERGDNAAAKKIYEQVLTFPAFAKASEGKPTLSNQVRPVKAKLASLLVEEDPDRALKLSEEVQLGGLDLWFGQAVVTWSQIMIAKEEWGEAQAVLETQLELLKQLEDSLAAQGQPVSLVSPLSGARYLLGVCYEHANKKADALHQFYNVYAKYGDSPWGPLSQEKAQALTEWFEGQGKTVKIDLGANLAKMEESAFRVARRLFFDRQYAEALPSYLTALNQFPEGEESITALRELCQSFIHLQDERAAKTVGLYLSERFSQDPKAGDALLATGKGALDGKQEELAWWMYDRYIESFPAHPRAPAVLFSLAGLKKQDALLTRIVKNYPDSSYHARALGRLAWNAYKAKDYETATARFAPYVETEADPKKQTRARFAFAESYRNLKLWGAGSVCFQTLEKSMEAAANSYGVSKETLKFNQPFWEKSIYYQAVCQKELGNLEEAVQTCDRFIETFPRSGILDQVRFTQGKTLIENESFAEALAALEPFGDGTAHEFAEPVLYYRGIAQFETGANETAVQTLEKLMLNFPASAFSFEAQFVQGRAYVAAGQRDEAIRVFGNILNFASDDLLIHRASLELGRAQTDPAKKLASFQRVALLADPEKHADLIAAALFESLPLYLELARPADLLADSERLTTEFKLLGSTTKIESLQEQAKTALAKQEEGTANECE